jgi:hypothetical protein
MTSKAATAHVGNIVAQRNDTIFFEGRSVLSSAGWERALFSLDKGGYRKLTPSSIECAANVVRPLRCSLRFNRYILWSDLERRYSILWPGASTLADRSAKRATEPTSLCGALQNAPPRHRARASRCAWARRNVRQGTARLLTFLFLWFHTDSRKIRVRETLDRRSVL